MRKKWVVYMFYPLNRDLKKVFLELYILRIFCVFYLVFYGMFIFLLHCSYALSMALSFIIIVIFMTIYLLFQKKKMKTTMDHLWLSETELKIEKVSKVLEEHGFYSNNEKLSLLLNYYKDKIKTNTIIHDVFSVLICVVVIFLPIVIQSRTIDSYIVTQVLSCFGILMLIYIGYLLFQKLWNFSFADLFNGQAFIQRTYEILFYIYCRRMNETSSEKKNLKKLAYDLKKKC